MKKVSAILAVLAFAIACQGQSEVEPEILVLGTYHMANPGRDMYNMNADDVLSPKRQREIEQLTEVLKRFQPTKIAVESEVGSKRVEQEYVDYLAGKHTLARNQIDQVGYRLAKELGQHTVYPVDVEGDFPMQRVINYAKDNGRGDKFEQMMSGWGTVVKEQGDYLHSHTVLEMLEYMNSDGRAAKRHGALLPGCALW